MSRDQGVSRPTMAFHCARILISVLAFSTAGVPLIECVDYKYEKQNFISPISDPEAVFDGKK